MSDDLSVGMLSNRANRLPTCHVLGLAVCVLLKETASSVAKTSESWSSLGGLCSLYCCEIANPSRVCVCVCVSCQLLQQDVIGVRT